MSASNKDVIRRLYQQVWNERKLEVLDQLISKTHALSDTMTVGASVGPEVYKRNVKRFVTAFPDLHFTVEDYVTEKDKVVASWSVTGTHKGEFIGIAPTARFSIPSRFGTRWACCSKWILPCPSTWKSGLPRPADPPPDRSFRRGVIFWSFYSNRELWPRFSWPENRGATSSEIPGCNLSNSSLSR